MMRREGNKGYSIVELVVVVSVLAIISAVAFSGLNAIRKNHAIEEDEVGIDIREISKQEFLLQGINFEEVMNPFEKYGDVEYRMEKTGSKLNAPGKNDISLLSVNFNSERDRINVVGKSIKDSGSPQEVKKMKLMPPIANFSGTINLNDFPIKKLIDSASNNPLGTYYRYTTDGTDPVISSPVWTFSPVSLTQWVPRMKFRAFNPDPRYTESVVLEVALMVTGEVIFQREDGLNSLEVSYSEVVNRVNRILLTVPGGGSVVQIRYRIKSSKNVDYSRPFHLPLKVWRANGITLIVEARIPQYDKSIEIKEFNLRIKKEKLAIPEIVTNCGVGCLSGSKVGIKVDRNIASTVTTVDGQDEEFYVQIEDI